MVRRARRWQIGTKQVDLPLIPLPNGLQARSVAFRKPYYILRCHCEMCLEHQRCVWSGDMVKAHIQHNKASRSLFDSVCIPLLLA